MTMVAHPENKHISLFTPISEAVSGMPDRIKSLSKSNQGTPIIAGLTLWGLIVPESIAYAKLAGSPPSAGLYTIIIGLPIFALFTSSRNLVATSTAAVSATLAGFLAVMASDVEVSLAALVICTGLAYMAFSLFRLGFLVNFISQPVNRGFIYGLTLFVMSSQLPKLFGVESTSGNFFERIFGFIQHIGETNIAVLVFSIFTLLFLFSLEKWRKSWPVGLIATALAMLAAYALQFESQFGMEMVGALPEDLPKLINPFGSLSDWEVAIPAGIGIAILGASEGIIVGEEFSEKYEYPIDTNQEFLAFGFSNIAVGFFGGLAGTGSMSSSAVNDSAGAKNLMSTIYAALITLLTVLFLGFVFVYLPEAFLGALIIHAVSGNLRLRTFKHIRAFSKNEYRLALAACLAVLIFDVLTGLIIAMLLNALYYIYQITKIRVVQFGMIEGDPSAFAPMDSRDVVKTPENVIVLGLISGAVFYATAETVKEELQNIINTLGENVQAIVLNVGTLGVADYSTVLVLKSAADSLKAKGIEFYITNVHNQQLWDHFHSEAFDDSQIQVSGRLDVQKLSADLYARNPKTAHNQNKKKDEINDKKT